MNPNVDDFDEEGLDLDYDKIYGGIDINPDSYQRPKEIEKEYKNIFGEVPKQFSKETLIGAGGTYGDLAELMGLQKSRDFKEDPYQKDVQDFQTLEKINQPGQSSVSDFEELSEDPMLPRSNRLPTSKNLEQFNELVGGPGQPETLLGKTAARSGRIYGSGLAFGQVNPIPALGAGLLGQATEELGGGPLLQAAAEIVTLLATQGKNLPVSSANKAIQDKVNQLRQLGYTEEDITLAINSANRGGKRAQMATKSQNTEQAFEDFTQRSDKIIGDVLSKEVPGFERGPKYVHELASDAYGQVAKQGSQLVIKDSTPFIESATNVVKELRKNLGKNPEAESFLNRLAEAVVDSTKNPTAESFMNFYKELNSMGKWMGRNQKDRLITQVKNGIKDTFRSEGKAGKQFADNFEKANEGIRKAYLAEDVSDIISKASTQDGIDYSKLRKAFDKTENVDLFTEVLGSEAAKNLKLIANEGKSVKDFDKAWKAVNSFRIGSPTDIARAGLASYYIYHGDWKGLAAVVASKGGSAAVKKLAEKSLTDPQFQRILIRGLHAVGTNSPQSLKLANEAMKKYFDQEGIDIPLD